MKTWKEIEAALKAPFAPEDLEWRLVNGTLGVSGSTGRPYAKCVPFVDSRAIQDRFDEVMGTENWRDEYAPGPVGGAMCGISLRLSPDHEWITKYDGADASDIEPVKGAFSNSLKRAAVKPGVGRYLYALPELWAICSLNKERGPEWKYQAKDRKNNRWPLFYWRAPKLPDEFLPAGVKMKGTKMEAEQPDPMDPKEQGEDSPSVEGLPADIHADLDQQETVADLKDKCAEYKPAGTEEGWLKAMYKFYDKKSRELEEIEMDKGGQS